MKKVASQARGPLESLMNKVSIIHIQLIQVCLAAVNARTIVMSHSNAINI